MCLFVSSAKELSILSPLHIDATTIDNVTQTKIGMFLASFTVNQARINDRLECLKIHLDLNCIIAWVLEVASIMNVR